MLRKKTIALREDLRGGVLSPEAEQQFIFGCIFYDEYTKENISAISKRKAASLSNDIIKLILRAIMLSNLDLENDKIAFETYDRLSAELANRYLVSKAQVEASLRRFKENHKEFFEDEASTCDNCKYLDDCPAEYQQEQPNYCENWESK